ncbi:hypothetical protein [Nostocoides veronense]|uniref:hypothetical protein n=1 Tax=Nostocoides veronense TaxID=330836 RepID=UPI0031E33907
MGVDLVKIAVTEASRALWSHIIDWFKSNPSSDPEIQKTLESTKPGNDIRVDDLLRILGALPPGTLERMMRNEGVDVTATRVAYAEGRGKVRVDGDAAGRDIYKNG